MPSGILTVECRGVCKKAILEERGYYLSGEKKQIDKVGKRFSLHWFSW